MCDRNQFYLNRLLVYKNVHSNLFCIHFRVCDCVLDSKRELIRGEPERAKEGKRERARESESLYLFCDMFESCKQEQRIRYYVEM